jgi:glycerate kinase
MSNPVIVIAPNAYKGSLTAAAAAACIACGFQRVFPEARCRLAPMADGGDGTMAVLARALNGRIRRLRATGPLGAPVSARFAVTPDGDLAILEMAEACGLRLLPPGRRNPMRTGTLGLGQLLVEARRLGCCRIVVGVGGSATVDGGLGLAEALGYRLFDARGRRLRGVGASLERLHAIEGWDIRRAWQSLDIQVAVDVTNPLLGPRGAARVFGPQKGATPAMVRRLESGLARFAALVRRDLGMAVARIPGGGAAGGLAAGLTVFCGARLTPGFDLVAGLTKLRETIQDADLVVTGEGFLDSQSLFGKVPVGVARLARSCRVPVLCLAGGLADDLPPAAALGMDAVVSLMPRPMRVEEAMQNAARLLTLAAERAANSLALGRRLGDRWKVSGGRRRGRGG